MTRSDFFKNCLVLVVLFLTIIGTSRITQAGMHSASPPMGAGTNNTSEVMLGKVLVNVVFVQSRVGPSFPPAGIKRTKDWDNPSNYGDTQETFANGYLASSLSSNLKSSQKFCSGMSRPSAKR